MQKTGRVRIEPEGICMWRRLGGLGDAPGGQGAGGENPSRNSPEEFWWIKAVFVWSQR